MLFIFAAAFTKKSGKHKSSHNETEEPLDEKGKTSSSKEESSRFIYKIDVPLPSTYNSHRLGKNMLKSHMQ